MTAGGIRRLFEHRGESPPRAGVRAMVPVNIRTAAEQLALGNRITSLFVHLPVAEPDPLRRYELQLDEAEGLKAGTQALGSREIIDLAAHAPPVIHTFLARALFATRLFNVTITNVPGPQMPLYAFGSRMRAVWPLVPLAAEHALGVAVFSYDYASSSASTRRATRFPTSTSSPTGSPARSRSWPSSGNRLTVRRSPPP